MGGAVSSGRDNNELIDNLMSGNYIRTRTVEKVFRALDRAEYMTPEARDHAYKDLAWRNGPLHMSAPCIYSEVMEALELKPGLSFLNVGSGTGYLSTLVGLIIGSSGINHGVEVHPLVVEYANKKLGQFMENSPTLDEFDFGEPKFYSGNGLCLAPLLAPYDRVYCGAGCPQEYQSYFQELIKVGGILVMPLCDHLLQVKRVGLYEWTSNKLLSVSFAELRVPSKTEPQEHVRLDEQTPSRLQALCRAEVRRCMRGAMRRRHPALRDPPPRAPPAKKACPRRICIPVDDDTDNELNALHDLDRTNGATEMNALLSLVLSMGHNRGAGALRVDPLDSESEGERDGSDDTDGDRDADVDGDSDRRDSDRRASGDSRPDGDGDGGGGNGDDDDDGGGNGPDNGAAGVRISRESSGSEGVCPGGSDGGGAGAGAGAGRRRGVIYIGVRDMHRARIDTTHLAAHIRHDKRHDATAPDDKSEPARRLPTRSRQSSSETESASRHDLQPSVPTEVEIYLEKTRDAPAPSTMEWEREDDTATSTSIAQDKRQKLDSGVGDTPSTASSARSFNSDDDNYNSHSLTDEGCETDIKVGGRRRRQKRAHLSTRSGSSSSSESESAQDTDGARDTDGAPHTEGDENMERALVGPEPPEDPALVRARRRQRRRLRESADARRVSLSVNMKRAVKELPLPHALKKYVNLGRCYQF